jgi:hypothetical protein
MVRIKISALCVRRTRSPARAEALLKQTETPHGIDLKNPFTMSNTRAAQRMSGDPVRGQNRHGN